MTYKTHNLLKKWGIFSQILSFYGACGITTFGWVLSRLLHFDGTPYLPLWFCGAVFIYNLDRLKIDPADAINMPRRTRMAAKFRKMSRIVAIVAGAGLVIIPALQRNWLMELLTLGGAVVCASYSFSFLGFRLKDVPLLKTFFAPTVLAAAYFLPPVLQQGAGNPPVYFLCAAAWTWCVLFFNMVLCDLRDIHGDARLGIKSLPVLLGAWMTVNALGFLLALTALFALGTIEHAPRENAVIWKTIGCGTVLYLALLLGAVKGGKPKSEGFYEWWVEGILFAPPLLYGIAVYCAR